METWGSHGSAGAGPASQTVIVLDTPLLSFPRRQAVETGEGGMGHPEIRPFMSFLICLREELSQLVRMMDRQSPLPGCFCDRDTLPS